ncbi:MAG TPA: hypothetical protein VGD63_05315 [Steroidobacteraceae bacterium]
MTLTDETLMAYADGEADAETRALVESAMRDDPEVRRQVERHRALREAMQGAYSSVLHEPVPDRLIAVARGQRAGERGPERAAAGVLRAPLRSASASRRWQPFAMAASLLMGIGLGYLGWHTSNGLVKSDASGGLIAGAGLAEALSNQFAADRPAASVAVTGISFRNKSGDYCRTFSLSGSSGLACREGSSWKIKVLAESAQPTQPAGAPDNFRQAGSADSTAVRVAVEESMAGEPLDQAGEIAARRSGWAAASAR